MGRLPPYVIPDRDQRRVYFLVILNWVQSVLVAPGFLLLYGVSSTENEIGQGICCVLGFLVMVIFVTVSFISYYRKRTWESLAFGCFYYWISPLWATALGAPIYVVLLLSIAPVITYWFMFRLFFESIRDRGSQGDGSDSVV